MAEIDDTPLETLQRGWALLQSLSSGQATKRGFERLVKQIHPEVQTTDDVAQEVAAPYVEQIQGLQGKLDAFLTAQQARDAKAVESQQAADLNAAFGRLRAQGLQDEGVEHVQKLMIDRNIADPEAAFALFERQNPKPAQTAAAWEPDSWNIESTAVERDVKGLFENPDRWADVEVHNVLREMRQVG